MTAAARRFSTPYMAIYVLLAAAFLAILNETVMSVAIPVIKFDLSVSASTAQWMTTAFLLTMAVVIPITGFLIARVPLKFLFLISEGLFVIGTAIGVFSPNFAMVIVGRIVQAAGTAVLLPLLMTTVMKLVPEQKRGQMMGNMSVVIAVAPAVGPTASGFVLKLTNNNWHALFEAMLPLGILITTVGFLLLPHTATDSQKPVDILSVLLSALGFGFSVYSLSLIETRGLTQVIPFAIIGGTCLGFFSWRQHVLAKSGRALLDLRVFKTSSFSLGTAMVCFSFLLMFGVIIILPLYLTAVGVSVLTVGLVLMPGPLLMGLMGPSVGKLYDMHGPRPLVIPGAAALTCGVAGLGFISLSTPLWWIIGCHIIVEIGLGLLITPLFTWSLGDLPENLYPDGSAVMSTLQQVCAAVGTALFVAVAGIATSVVTQHDAPTAENVVAGFGFSMWTAAALGVITIILALRVRPHRRETTELV